MRDGNRLFLLKDVHKRCTYLSNGNNWILKLQENGRALQPSFLPPSTMMSFGEHLYHIPIRQLRYLHAHTINCTNIENLADTESFHHMHTSWNTRINKTCGEVCNRGNTIDLSSYPFMTTSKEARTLTIYTSNSGKSHYTPILCTSSKTSANPLFDHDVLLPAI